MNREPLPDRLLPAVYALALHAVVVGVLVLSLGDAPTPVAAGPRPEPVEAVVVDEKLITDELERLRDQDERRRREERERVERLEKQAEEARRQRTQEERRLSELERLQRERQREYIATERERERREAERLAELKQEREAEAEQLALLQQQRREEAEKARRIEERAQAAEAERKKAEEARRAEEEKRKRIEAEKKKAEAERKRIEEQKRRAEAERKKAEEARRKAEEERRRKEMEIALQEEIAKAAQELEKERLALLDAGRAEYIAQIKDKIERNWLRPPGAPTGLKCVVRVSQIPGGEVVQAEIRTSSGNVAFDRSVEDAVLRASPLPAPKDPELFDRHIVITFEPEG